MLGFVSASNSLTSPSCSQCLSKSPSSLNELIQNALSACSQAPQANRVQGTVLEPCCIGADVKMYPGGKGDCELTLSDLRLNISADLLELAQNLERNVLGPLAYPSPEK